MDSVCHGCPQLDESDRQSAYRTPMLTDDGLNRLKPFPSAALAVVMLFVGELQSFWGQLNGLSNAEHKQ